MQARTSLRIAVCDDSPIFLNKTKTYIETWSANTGHAVQIFTYDNGDALIEAHKDCHMDIIFLDIIMPLLNGMDTARELRQHDRAVQIIFLTSSPEFALESYEVRAQGYILKPVSQEKLTKELNEAKVLFNDPNATQEQVDNAKAVLEKAIAELQTVTTDSAIKTPVNNGDITSVKTGDDINMLGTLGLVLPLGVIVYLNKRRKGENI